MSDIRISTLDELEANGKIENPEPYVYVCRKSTKKITFPDPGLLDLEQAKGFLEALNTKRDVDFLEYWVGEEAMKVLLNEGWNVRQKNAVIGDIFLHYSEFFGTVGE